MTKHSRDDKEEDALARLKRLAKLLYYLFTIGFYLFCMALLLVVFMFFSNFFAPGMNIINAQMDGETLLLFSSGLLTALVLRIASRVFFDTSKGEPPFTMRQVRRIQLAAILLLLKALLVTVLSESFISLITLNSFQFGYGTPIAATGAIPLDAGGIVWAIVFLCLSFVFEYGAKLQEQSDDTV